VHTLSSYLSRLEEIYARLEVLTSTVPLASAGNPCGSCFSCCSYPIHLKVSALELAFLEREEAFRERVFLAFVNRSIDEKGALVRVCPHYDQGCAVYRSRPMCCRAFGYIPFRELGRECSFHSLDRTFFKWRDMDRLFTDFSELRLSYYREHGSSIQIRTVMDFLISGNVLVEEGEFEKAFTHFDRALALDQESSLAHSYQAKKYEIMNELPRAEKAYRKALELDPEEPVLYVKLGFVCYGKGEFEGALALYDEALRRDPQCYMAYGNRGLALIALGRFPEALSAYDQALILEPHNSTFHLMKGNILETAGHDDEALEEFTAAAAIDSRDPLACLCLAKLHKKKGNRQEALRYFREFSTLTDSPRFRAIAEAEIEALTGS
jgi:Flp pilus assembly protein TadD